MKSEFKYNRLDKNDAAVLLVDHQSGLTNLVQDFSPDDFKNNVLALADAAKYCPEVLVLTSPTWPTLELSSSPVKVFIRMGLRRNSHE